MKKILFAVMAASISLGAAASAFAAPTTYSECFAEHLQNTPENSLVKKCNMFIVGESQINLGVNTGKVWKEAYPNVKFKSATDSDVRLHKKKLWFGFTPRTKYVWEVKGQEAVRAKQIAPKDIDANLYKVGLKLVNGEPTKL